MTSFTFNTTASIVFEPGNPREVTQAHALAISRAAW
jgi:hypothetical protein